MSDCLFCDIVSGEQPSERVDAGDGVVAIRDKFPQAPVHVLVITEQHVPSAHALSAEHDDLLASCFRMARKVAEAEGTADGYRIATNVGRKGGQAIEHLHFHVIGGRQLGHVDDAG